MGASDSGTGLFQAFDYNGGRESLRSLHLMLQIMGKVRLELFPERESFQHLTLFTNARGFTTRPIPTRGMVVEIALDLVDLVCRVEASDGRSWEIPLQTPIGLFYRAFAQAMAELEIDSPKRTAPYDVPAETIPFGEDMQTREFDAAKVRSIWQIYVGINTVLEELASGFPGKIFYPQFYWHHLDISSYRFFKPAGDNPEQSISTGFWIGDDNVREPMLFSYIYPTPEGIGDTALQPAGAFWGDNHMALLKYNDVAESSDPHGACLSFYRSALSVFTQAGQWTVK